MPQPPDLSSLYTWFQLELDRPNARPGPPAIPADHAPVSEVILPSKSLSPQERLDCYQTAVRLRFVEILGNDFQAIQHIIGYDRFSELALWYLTQFPSRSFTLNKLAHHLPGFLRSLPVSQLPERDLLLDLARLELAMTELVDCEHGDVLTPEWLADIPMDLFADARLQPIPAIRVFAFHHRANAIVSAIRMEHDEVPSFDRVDTFAVAYRKPDYVIWRRDLNQPMFVLLRALVTGHRLGDAIAIASRAWHGDDEELEARIFQWFGEFIGEGMFARVLLPDAATVS